MLPKKTILISAVLTAFVLSVLGGVVFALKQPATSATAIASASISAQEAAALAASALNQQDIYSVESATYNGINAYKVVFSSGQVAYVGLNGQILSVTQNQPVAGNQNNTFFAPSVAAPVAPVSSVHEQHDEGDHDD